MVLNHSQQSTKPSAPSAQKHERQPQRCVIHAMPGAKRTSEKYCAELNVAEARPRSAEGNHVVTMRPLPGKTGACTSPESRRMASVTPKISAGASPPAKPTSSAQSDHARMLMP